VASTSVLPRTTGEA